MLRQLVPHMQSDFAYHFYALAVHAGVLHGFLYLILQPSDEDPAPIKCRHCMGALVLVPHVSQQKRSGRIRHKKESYEKIHGLPAFAVASTSSYRFAEVRSVQQAVRPAANMRRRRKSQLALQPCVARSLRNFIPARGIFCRGCWHRCAVVFHCKIYQYAHFNIFKVLQSAASIS